MKNEQIIRMGELQAIIDATQKELDELKAIARTEANGEQMAFQAEGVSVIVSKPGKATETLDTKAFQIKAPKLYAEVFGKYHKTGSPRAAAVKVALSK